MRRPAGPPPMIQTLLSDIVIKIIKREEGELAFNVILEE